MEFAATVPADVKFKDGNLKYLLKSVFKDQLPETIVNRRDEMGFPVPLNEWFSGELNDFVRDVFSGMTQRNRPFFNAASIQNNFGDEAQFSRKTWGLLK